MSEMLDHDILIGMRAELRVKLENIEAQIKDLKDTTKAQVYDHETRLRKVEAARWKTIGIATAASFVLTVSGMIAAWALVLH